MSGGAFCGRWNRWRGLAALLEPFGSDRGGMVVRVLGRRPDGVHERRTWTLIAAAGDGPEIPALVARVLCRRALGGKLAPGARACLNEAPLSAILDEAAGLRLHAATAGEPVEPLFRQALGPAFDVLPPQVRALNAEVGTSRWRGLADIETGSSPAAAPVRRLFGFPGGGSAIPVTVEMRRTGTAEVWTRTFGGRRLRSVLRLAGPAGSGRITERFGPVRVEIALAPAPGGLGFPVRRGWFLGLPLPRRLLPDSRTREFAQAGAAHFDVSLRLPVLGQMVRYRGVLRPVDAAEANPADGADRAAARPPPAARLGRG